MGKTRDINSTLRECSIGISKEQLLYMYNESTKKKFDTMIINLD